MSKKSRIKKLENAVMPNESLCCLGVVGDPQSEKRYQEYLRLGIKKPFVWVRTGVPRSF